MPRAAGVAPGRAVTSAQDQQVSAIASRILQAQASARTHMQAMGDGWGVGLHSAAGHGAGHSSTQAGGDVIAHDEGRLLMARTKGTVGSKRQAIGLAEEILRPQQAEVTMMRELLTQL